MKSVVGDHENGDSGIGLLLFDEPSASLDPTAEHGKTLWPSSFVNNWPTDRFIRASAEIEGK